MAENEVVVATAKSAKFMNPKTAPQHPKVAIMVNAAISTLKEPGGSSLQAIKKYIASHYKADVQKISPFIKKYLKNSVESGTLVQTKGKGASGSFKMALQPKEKAKPKFAAKIPKAPKTIIPKSKKVTGRRIMSCHGSGFAPSRSEVIHIGIAGLMKVDGTSKAPSIKKTKK